MNPAKELVRDLWPEATPDQIDRLALALERAFKKIYFDPLTR